jgi:hypothetical protein
MRARWFLAALGAGLAAVGFGCSAVLGVDFGDAHPKVGLDPDAGGKIQVDPNDEAGIGEVPDAAPTGCAADEKKCNGVCVKKSDPLHGCGGASCAPCSLVNATEAQCSAEGVCIVKTCAPGRADCNGLPGDGCEADLSAPATCGSCTVACGGGNPLCTPTGCAASCPGGTTQCGSSCVDTKTNADNCGQCGKKCAQVTNGAAVCNNSNCAVQCNAGFGDCNNNPLDGCEPLQQFFLDGDGDGVGGATTQMACTPPGANWVTTGGDCHDGNPQVHPGQTAYFATSYTTTSGVESYDYDCNGAEQEEGTPAHFVGGCGALCDNFGYIVKSPTRSGTGVNNYCGSTTERECIDNGGLNPVSLPLLPPGGCTANNLPGAPAIKCH